MLLDGTAREAALAFPKSSNVAATVALAGLGFDNTEVRVIADPAVSSNIHTIDAEGAFGSFSFRIEGLPLPDNPRSSSLTAMSILREIRNFGSAIGYDAALSARVIRLTHKQHRRISARG
ncbi:aspartate dehydrogenase domain-containing protein [uncultured Jannaschia sp.]|uniref:aspartate dehydrogenase domain-containing protein n=1 Tax=uncultured Jannaschia sp. TaxID=293347 RepID=UPI00260B8AAB|nr:aspartate dehydrogenase domain-containing protein [uncultured Jannaschia sp.]